MAGPKTGTTWWLWNAEFSCRVSSFRAVVKSLLLGIAPVLAGKKNKKWCAFKSRVSLQQWPDENTANASTSDLLALHLRQGKYFLTVSINQQCGRWGRVVRGSFVPASHLPVSSHLTPKSAFAPVCFHPHIHSVAVQALSLLSACLVSTWNPTQPTPSHCKPSLNNNRFMDTHRGPDVWKLGLFKSKLHRKLEPKNLQAPLLFTWVFSSPLGDPAALLTTVFFSSRKKKVRAPVWKWTRRPHPVLA